jgi:acetoin utilization deacetylase AcuC-like enzyme
VAAAAARARGVSRVAIVDWDVHHGNGTQDAFFDDSTVLTISIHHDRLFPPDSGGADEVGAGTNVNVPLPPGCGEGAYADAMRRVVMPAVRAFAPELIVVACGYDASALDPLGRMQLRAASFARLAQAVLELAAELCDGRLVCVHEGGYSEYYVPFCGLAVVEQLAGVRTGIEDPYFRRSASLPTTICRPPAPGDRRRRARRAAMTSETPSYSRLAHEVLAAGPQLWCARLDCRRRWRHYHVI